jgi:hypothetical protein
LTTPWGLPCCVRFPCVHAVANTAAQRLGVAGWCLRYHHYFRKVRPARAPSLWGWEYNSPWDPTAIEGEGNLPSQSIPAGTTYWTAANLAWQNFKGEVIAQNLDDLHSDNNKVGMQTSLTERSFCPYRAGRCGRRALALLSSPCCMSRIGRHRFLRRVHNSRQPDREDRSATGLARDRDVASHHLTEALRAL